MCNDESFVWVVLAHSTRQGRVIICHTYPKLVGEYETLEEAEKAADAYPGRTEVLWPAGI